MIEDYIKSRGINISKESEVVPSKCCECGYVCDMASGPTSPGPGDWSLCIKCACLNVFADDMTLRPATEEEMIEAAGVKKLKILREAILHVNKKGMEK